MTELGSQQGNSSTGSGRGRIGLFAAMSIGIGGMIGAGIFSILGVVAQASGTAMWVSFLIGGFVALLSTYSYAKLGARYPSAGGAVEFLLKGFGDGVLSGGINLYMWIGYVIALALYAQAFAGYAMTFLPPAMPGWLPKAIGVVVVLAFTALNLIGAQVVGRSETLIVAVKLIILAVVRDCRSVFHSSRIFSTRTVARVFGDPIWCGSSLYRIRGFRIGGKLCGRHGQSSEVTTESPLFKRGCCNSSFTLPYRWL